MGSDRKKAIKRFVLMNIVLIVSCAAFCVYSLLNRHVEIPIFRCYMSELLHVYCAFCGGTRAIAALIGGDLLSALRYNSLTVYLVLAFIAYEIQALVNTLKGKEDALSIPAWMLWISIAVFIAYCVIRNVLLIGFGYDPLGDLAVYW